jgi:endoglucanase
MNKRIRLMPALVACLLLAGLPTTRAEDAKPAETNAAPALPIRIRAGDTATFTDSSGNVWQGDQGFDDGEIITRPAGTKITNTKDEALYLSERYSMTHFSQKLPNGKYTVKLHFAETFEEIDGPGQRVFTFKVEDKEFKDFDIFVKAGGAMRPYVETVDVEVNDGKLDITFTANVQYPEINGIEIDRAK